MTSQDNGVIRISRKGKKKFAFGEDGEPFEIDVVVAFQDWLVVDDGFRQSNPETREIPATAMEEYHAAAVQFVFNLGGRLQTEITTAEALDFLARLRESYDDVSYFFQPRSRRERGLPDILEEGSNGTLAKTEMEFSTDTE